MTRFTLTLAATMALAGTAFAQEIADTNGDGAYSLEELQVALPELTADGFVSIDANADGMVSPDELAAAVADGAVTLPE
ncbi:MAG: hypothetical protein Q7J57_09860 [Gemmobacter sp.]|nr:hypothetical protein [Gemmobacter sp.]